MFNSGGMGARPTLDGLSATAFPSGVQTMPVEATEQTGPIIVWRKELRPDSAGDGEFRGGLGQIIEIEAMAGHEFKVSAMLDRIHSPAAGRHGGQAGAPGRIRRADGTPLRGKGWQSIEAGQRIVLELPGGGGFGDPARRDPTARADDRRKGYVSDRS